MNDKSVHAFDAHPLRARGDCTSPASGSPEALSESGSRFDSVLYTEHEVTAIRPRLFKESMGNFEFVRERFIQVHSSSGLPRGPCGPRVWERASVALLLHSDVTVTGRAVAGEQGRGRNTACEGAPRGGCGGKGSKWGGRRFISLHGCYCETLSHIRMTSQTKWISWDLVDYLRSGAAYWARTSCRRRRRREHTSGLIGMSQKVNVEDIFAHAEVVERRKLVGQFHDSNKFDFER